MQPEWLCSVHLRLFESSASEPWIPESKPKSKFKSKSFSRRVVGLACTLDVSIKVSFHVNCFSVAVWRRLSPESSKFAAHSSPMEESNGPEPFCLNIYIFFFRIRMVSSWAGWQAHYIHVRPHFHTYPADVLRSLRQQWSFVTACLNWGICWPRLSSVLTWSAY